MNNTEYRNLQINDTVQIQGNAKHRGCYAKVKKAYTPDTPMATEVIVELVSGEVKSYSYKSLKLATVLEIEANDKAKASSDAKDSLLKDDLISVVRTLLAIRANYEKKFGIIMHADGSTEKIRRNKHSR